MGARRWEAAGNVGRTDQRGHELPLFPTRRSRSPRCTFWMDRGSRQPPRNRQNARASCPLRVHRANQPLRRHSHAQVWRHPIIAALWLVALSGDVRQGCPKPECSEQPCPSLQRAPFTACGERRGAPSRSPIQRHAQTPHCPSSVVASPPILILARRLSFAGQDHPPSISTPRRRTTIVGHFSRP
jgi:hypothetical protein